MYSDRLLIENWKMIFKNEIIFLYRKLFDEANNLLFISSAIFSLQNISGCQVRFTCQVSFKIFYKPSASLNMLYCFPSYFHTVFSGLKGYINNDM